ncbi:MAG: hypothetical protein WDM88_10820 [Galbitalea sp.]
MIPKIRLYSAGENASADEENFYAGRSVLRSQILAMSSLRDVDPASTAKALRPRDAGVLWSIVQPDGLDLALRARDYPNPRTAMRDVRRILSRVGELRHEFAQSTADGRLSWWISLDGEVVLVGGRPRSANRQAELNREVRSVRRALARLAELQAARQRK